MNILPKTAIVTGGTIRLGKFIADGLESRGWRTIRTSHREDAGADAILDFSGEPEAGKFFDCILEATGGAMPEALVCNAALFHSAGEAALLRANLDWQRELVDKFASFHDGKGCAVVVTDAAAYLPRRGNADAYLETKRALAALVPELAARHAGKLRVNAVAPGPVLAPVEKGIKAPPTPFGRPTPADVASAVAFLLETKSTTGCSIPVDGGGRLDTLL